MHFKGLSCLLLALIASVATGEGRPSHEWVQGSTCRPVLVQAAALEFPSSTCPFCSLLLARTGAPTCA